MLVYSQMVFATFFAWLILGETIAWYHYVGAGLVIIGVIMVTLLRMPADAGGGTQ
jgi:drug/metabolite transporter (DMT)-like permease